MTDDSSQPLIGVDAKLARAKEHVDALEAEMSGVYTNPQALGLDVRSEWEFAVLWNFPSVIHASTVAGDAVHNIRSALDYLVWDLVANAGVAKPGRHTNFPIFDKKEDFCENALRVRPGRKPALHWLKPRSTALRLIVSEQPYRSHDPRHHALFFIKKLLNIDKHQTLFPHPTSRIQTSCNRSLKWNPEARLTSTYVIGPGQPMEGGTELMRVTFRPFRATPQSEHERKPPRDRLPRPQFHIIRESV